ncbi:MAG TPA: hypothetical protein VJ385_09680 [Fibrobacteria bacterium]|nr:hypothetical protein [Fibrobacteria bacterium]
MADHAGKSGQSGVSGRVVVIVLFAGAVLLWGIVFLVGLRQRASDRAGRDAQDAADSAVTAEEVRAWMKALPEEWIEVSLVEGQGYVLYVPCYSSNGSLALRTAPDSLPGLSCEYCDSLDNYSVKSILRTRRDSVWDLRLDPPAGRLRILPVNDSLLKRFPEAPFKDKLLLWTRSLADGRTDSMIFVPKSQETEFEVLRAEDENPEGCGGTDPD